jgi:hypothetical protein
MRLRFLASRKILMRPPTWRRGSINMLTDPACRKFLKMMA